MLVGRAIKIVWHGPSREMSSACPSVPFGLVLGNPDYLVAAATGESIPELLPLDCIGDVIVLAEEAHRPADFDLRSFAEQSLGQILAG